MDEFTQDYLVQEVESADPAKLVELLYQRALRDLMNARELWSMLDKDPASIRLLVHAQCIVMELQKSLNYEQGGEVALNLSRLYDFIQFSIVEITRDRTPDDAKKIEDLIEILSSISDAWSTMARQQRESQSVRSLSSNEILVA